MKTDFVPGKDRGRSDAIPVAGLFTTGAKVHGL